MISRPLQLASVARAIEADFLATGRFPGGHLRVLQQGELVFDACLGMMDVARSRPWREDTIVRIYSMTKPIVSAAAMRLIERGVIALDQPVSDFLPSWRNQRVWIAGKGGDLRTEPTIRPSNLRDLLCHTAGLTYGTRLARVGGAAVEDPVALLYPDPTDNLQAYADALGHLPLRYQPGEHWMYSVATDIVGAILERVSGLPLGQLLARELFEPLAMTETGFQVSAAAADRLAACYIATSKGGMTLADDPAESAVLKPAIFESGGGGLTSTMADYARFAEMLRQGGGALLRAESIASMRANHLPNGAELKEVALISDPNLLPDGVGFGLGLASTLDEARSGVPATGDFYWSGAATTIWWVDPSRDLTALFFTQLLPATAYGFQDWLKRRVYDALG